METRSRDPAPSALGLTPTGRRRARLGLTSLLIGAVLVATLTGSGYGALQLRRYMTGDPPEVSYENVPYDHRFAFVRIRFEPTAWGPGRYMWGLDLGWNHDYPRAENNFMRILEETTSLAPNLEGSLILSLDDPRLFQYPWAYICEVGVWAPGTAEVTNLRSYLRKGGMLVVDDFRGGDWHNFVEQIQRVLPEARLQRIPRSHPVFNTLFELDRLDRLGDRGFGRWGRPGIEGGGGSYYAVFEDNDPRGRVMVLANYNQDVGEYWEFSDTGFIPIELSNEAYKLGVNYVIYGLIH